MRDPLLSLARVTLKSIWTVSDALRRPLTRPAPAPCPLTLADRRVVAHDQNVVAFTFTSADGRPLPGWHPGAHLDIHLPSGRVRQYSLCGDPAVRTAYRIAVRRIPDGGGGSIEMHDALSIGSTVTTGGPRNAFPLVVPGTARPPPACGSSPGHRDYPILPMLGLADSLGSDWSMIYVGRSADSIPSSMRSATSAPASRSAPTTPTGFRARTSSWANASMAQPFMRGPAPMLTLIRDRLIGRDNVELHFERFAAPRL